jgi:hypothetical protein
VLWTRFGWVTCNMPKEACEYRKEHGVWGKSLILFRVGICVCGPLARCTWCFFFFVWRIVCFSFVSNRSSYQIFYKVHNLESAWRRHLLQKTSRNSKCRTRILISTTIHMSSRWTTDLEHLEERKVVSIMESNMYAILKLALSDTPDFSTRIVRLLVDRTSWSNRFLTVFKVKALILLHRLDGLALYALEEFFVGRDIVNESNDLTSSPDLWYC